MWISSIVSASLDSLVGNPVLAMILHTFQWMMSVISVVVSFSDVSIASKEVEYVAIIIRLMMMQRNCVMRAIGGDCSETAMSN